MPRHVIADRVKEITGTLGTGTVALEGAAVGFRSFLAGIGVGNETDYCIISGDGIGWEVGIGTVGAGGLTFTRDRVVASSAGATKISLSGTSTIYTTASAARLSGKLVIVPEDAGATAGTGDNAAALEAWIAKIIATGLPGYLPPGIAYPCATAMVWDLTAAGSKGITIDGAGIKQSLIDLSAVTTAPALKIRAAGSTFYHEFARFGVEGNLAGTLVQLGERDYSDAFNTCAFNLQVQNGSTSAAACAVEINHVLNSRPLSIVANSGGRGTGTAMRLRRSIMNTFLGSAGNAKTAVQFDDAVGGSDYGNGFYGFDIEECTIPVQCDTDFASNNSWIGGTMVWENPDIPNGGAFVMNAGSNSFRVSGTQPARYDAGSIYPLAVGAKAAVVIWDPYITGTENFEAVNIAPRDKDADLVAIVPAGFNGGLTIREAGTDKARWRIVTTGSGTALNITRFDPATGAALDNPVSIDYGTGRATVLDLAVPVGGKLGVFGAVPTTQPNPASGNDNPATAGAGGAVLYDTGFTGGIGTTELTVGKIAYILKSVGLAPS